MNSKTFTVQWHCPICLAQGEFKMAHDASLGTAICNMVNKHAETDPTCSASPGLGARPDPATFCLSHTGMIDLLKELADKLPSKGWPDGPWNSETELKDRVKGMIADLEAVKALNSPAVNQMSLNFSWLLQHIDQIHRLVNARIGTWQQRAERAVVEVRRLAEETQRLKKALKDVEGLAQSCYLDPKDIYIIAHVALKISDDQQRSRLTGGQSVDAVPADGAAS
jgi:hypothetical protein